MLYRNSYKSREKGTSNEPAALKDFEHLREYPDMKKYYQIFSDLIELPTNQFILANGGENAIKNTLLAIKPKNMFFSYPTWGMLDVYCEALDINPIRSELIVNEDGDIFEDEKYFEMLDGVDCFYSCAGINNYVSYNPIIEDGNFWRILDLTYHDWHSIKCHCASLNAEKEVVVGSFDKMLGCGIRLGFAVFPRQFNDRFQLQREQFLNYSACQILEYLEKNPEVLRRSNCQERAEKFWKTCLPAQIYKEDIITKTNNYITFRGNLDLNVPNIKFEIDGKKFTRIGISE